MKRELLYKKHYKHKYIDSAFGGILSLVLILGNNLMSHTLSISARKLILILFFTVLILSSSMLIKVFLLYSDIKTENAIMISTISKLGYKIILFFWWLPIVTLCCGVLTKQDHIIFFFILLSIMLLMCMKAYFDNIVVFFHNGYSCGFDSIKIDHHCRVVEKSRTRKLFQEDVILFDIYYEHKVIGFDKFYESDYNYLLGILCKHISEDHQHSF